MNRALLFNSLFPALCAATITGLGLLGEERLDVYVSLITLWYLILKALIRPPRRALDIVLVALLTLFAYFVFVRVLEIVGAGA